MLGIKNKYKLLPAEDLDGMENVRATKHVPSSLSKAISALENDKVLKSKIGGEEWLKAAKNIETQLGIKIQCNIIGPDQDFEDHAGEWSSIREISDSGLILVRPDQHICWRSKDMISNSSEKLMDVMKKILHKR